LTGIAKRVYYRPETIDKPVFVSCFYGTFISRTAKHQNTMTNWYYYNASGEKIAITGKQLKELAQQGIITPETVVETEEGKAAPAGKVKGLPFAETKLPEAVKPIETEIYGLSPFEPMAASPNVMPPPTSPIPPKAEMPVEPPASPTSTKPMAPMVALPLSFPELCITFKKPKVLIPTCIAMALLCFLLWPMRSPLPAIIVIQEKLDESMADCYSAWNIVSTGNRNSPISKSYAEESILKTGVRIDQDKELKTMRSKMKKLIRNKSRYENTIKLYTILIKYNESVKALDGTPDSYANDLLSYRKEFSQTLPLAELEW